MADGSVIIKADVDDKQAQTELNRLTKKIDALNEKISDKKQEQKVTVFRRGNDYRSYDAFWNYLKAHSVDDSVLLEAADGNSTISYRAYYTSASHDIEKVENGINYWGEIEIHFIPIAPQITR